MLSRWKLGIFAVLPRTIAAQGPAELHLAETETVAEAVRRAGELFELCATFGIQQIELFGAARCNFESNFPVDKMGTGYATLWNAFKRITAGCSQTEKLALYSGTAKRLYQLD